MSKKMILAGVLAVFLNTAYTQDIEIYGDSVQLESVVITASKIPQTPKNTAKPVVVITRKQIEKSGSKDIAQLLQKQVGIIVNGGI